MSWHRPPLDHLLDVSQRPPNPNAEASTAALRAIVKRRDRRVRGAGVFLALAGLTLGAGGVSAVGRFLWSSAPVGSVQVFAAAPAPDPTVSRQGGTAASNDALAPGAAASASSSASTMTRLLTHVNGKTTTNLFSLGEQCLQVEVSTPLSATTLGIPVATVAPNALTAVASTVVGGTEADPTWLVVAKVGSAVSRATITFADGSQDQATVQLGWVVLTHSASQPNMPNGAKPLGTIKALNGNGAVLVQSTLPVADPPACPHNP